MLGGAVTYVVGMFCCTVALNVPLNNALGVVDPASAEASGVWSRYLKVWTLWDHDRTVVSMGGTRVRGDVPIKRTDHTYESFIGAAAGFGSRKIGHHADTERGAA